MGSVICGAKTREGRPCIAIAVVGSNRCRHHGGLSTGPTTLLGRLASGDRLKVYRVNGAPPGHRKTDKAQRRREAKAKRRAVWEARRERREARKAKWERRKWLESGLPLFSEPELENL
jgi:hypothetical protein